MLDRFAAEADRLEAEARSIRSRVPRASSSSQHVMRAEAAALERAARRIRDQIEACEQQADDAPDPSEQEYEDGFPVHIAGGMF